MVCFTRRAGLLWTQASAKFHGLCCGDHVQLGLFSILKYVKFGGLMHKFAKKMIEFCLHLCTKKCLKFSGLWVYFFVGLMGI